MIINGADGSSIRVTQFDSNGALLYIDPDGDGEALVLPIAWSALF